LACVSPLSPAPRDSTAPPAISLVIAVYERADVLALLFRALAGQSFQDFEVRIADDGSGPAVAAAIARGRERLGDRIAHVRHDDDGFRKTIIVNLAVAGARGELLVFLDGDCIPHHRFLERHWVRRRAGQVLSGRRLMMDASLTSRLTEADVASRRVESPSFWWDHVPAHDRRNGFYVPLAFGLRGRKWKPYEILGSNFSLPREVFLAVNGYDERIQGRGMEDVNLKARLVNAGYRLRSISQEALQYHCYHSNSGFPHGAAAVARWGGTTETRTAFGMTREPGPRGDI
jgi:glycosyltransferase involved in cell wall biosynthesis